MSFKGFGVAFQTVHAKLSNIFTNFYWSMVSFDANMNNNAILQTCHWINYGEIDSQEGTRGLCAAMDFPPLRGNFILSILTEIHVNILGSWLLWNLNNIKSSIYENIFFLVYGSPIHRTRRIESFSCPTSLSGKSILNIQTRALRQNSVDFATAVYYAKETACK